jgi:ribose/xylose/arabinose/galactoside ABC-type transport system permease subunit
MGIDTQAPPAIEREGREPAVPINWHRFVLPLVFIALCVLFGLLNPRFYSATNAQNVVMQVSVLALMAIGELFVILSGGFDLSIGTMVGLVSALTAMAMVNFGIPAAILIGMLTGTAVGLFNGMLVARLRLSPFVVTLGTLSIAKGLALTITGGIPITKLPREFGALGSGFFGPLHLRSDCGSRLPRGLVRPDQDTVRSLRICHWGQRTGSSPIRYQRGVL